MISGNNCQCNNCVSCDVVQVTAEGDFSSAIIYMEIIRMVHEADQGAIRRAFILMTLGVPFTYCYLCKEHSTDNICLFIKNSF